MNQQHVPTLPIRSLLNEGVLSAPVRVEDQIRACSDWLQATKRDALLLFISVHHPALNVGLALSWTVEQFKNLLLPNVSPRDLRRGMYRFSLDHGLPTPAVKPPPLPPWAKQPQPAQPPAEPLPVRASCDRETPVPRLPVSSLLSGLTLAGLLLFGLASFARYLMDEPPQAARTRQTPQANAGYVQRTPPIQEVWAPPSQEVPKPALVIKKIERTRRKHRAGAPAGVVKIGKPIQTPALNAAGPSSDGAAKIVSVDTSYKCECPGRRFIMLRFPGPPPRNGTPEAEEVAKKAQLRCDEIAEQTQ